MNLSVASKEWLELMRPTAVPERSLLLMVAAAACGFLCAVVIALPAMIFSYPGDNAYIHFSRILACEPASYVPLGFTALATSLSLLLPLRPNWQALLSHLRHDPDSPSEPA